MTAIHATIEHAGFIVTNNEVIWGVGTTADEAWSDFVQAAGVPVVDEVTDEMIEDSHEFIRASDYTIRSATAALIADVAERGGDIDWKIAGGIACTRTEFEER